MRLAILGSIALLLVPTAVFPAFAGEDVPAAPGDPISLRVEIEGLDKELEANARLHLSLLTLGKGSLQQRKEGLPNEEMKKRKQERKAEKKAAKRAEQTTGQSQFTTTPREPQEEIEEITGPRIMAFHRRAEEEIRAALEPFGYYRPVIDASLDSAGVEWIARYRVDPGPALRVRDKRVEVLGEGREDPGIAAAALAFPLDAGDTVVHGLYEEGKAALEAAAATEGYLDAAYQTSEIRVDLIDYYASVVVVYDTGPRYFFGETRLEQTVVDPDIVRGYIPWESGEPLDQDKLLELQVDLGGSPYFRRVEVEPKREDAVDRQVPIDVRMVPAKPRIFRGGLGYGTDTGVRGRGGFEWRRVNRRGHQANADIVLSEIERSFESHYRMPAPYPRTDVISFAAGYADEDTDTARSQTGLLSGSFSRNLGTWRESFTLGFRREDFEVGVDSGVSDLLVPEVAFGKVKSDDRIYPTWGRRLDFAARGAAEGWLTDTSFVQLTGRAKGIWSFGRTRLISRAELGWTDTSDFRSLPASLRFFAGGDQSVRGYDYQELGPLDEENNVIGGEALVVGSVELDRLFFDFGRFGQWGAAVFYDVGGAAHDFGKSLESGVGAGLRWLSPIGLVRLDAAVALDRPGSPIRIHLNVGPDF
ncbi:MAG TPA: autotransporter assembly complex family protein [Thermoanaerobaculia bacterium]|nr:autotransporter assembly complex family protein [Thermoanaerobaculia bacterium]